MSLGREKSARIPPLPPNHDHLTKNLVSNIGKVSDSNIENYDNFFIVGDCNSETREIYILRHVLNTCNIILPISHLSRGMLEFSEQIFWH